jgi:hypothetical protein
MAEPTFKLKQGIYEAFLKSMTYMPSIDVIDDEGKMIGNEHGDPIEPSVDQSVKDLSNMLGDSIVKWVHSQQFTVVDLEMSQLTKPLTVVTPTGPGILPPTLLTTSVKDTTQVSPSFDNPKASVESMNSIVELKPDNTTGIEDV